MRFLDLFFATRPLLQLPIWTVYLVSLHYHHQLSGERFDWTDLLMMGGISLLFSAAAYINQVYDFDSDRINNKVGFLQNGLVTTRQMTVGFFILCLVPLVASAFVSIFTLSIFAQWTVLAYAYSVPPLKLKDRPVGGLLANAWGHGLLVSVAVMPNLDIHNAGLLGWDNPFYFFLAVGATYVITTIPDRAGDEATGKLTLAVRLGRNGAMAVAMVLLILASLVAYTSGYAVLFYVALLAVMLVLASLLIRTEAAVRFAAKGPLLLLTLLAGYHYWGYFLFVVALLILTRTYYLKRFGIIYPVLN